MLSFILVFFPHFFVRVYERAGYSEQLWLASNSRRGQFVALQICLKAADWTPESAKRSDVFGSKTRLFCNHRDWPDRDWRQKAVFSPLTKVYSVFTEKNKSVLIEFAINIPRLCIGTVTNTTAMLL